MRDDMSEDLEYQRAKRGSMQALTAVLILVSLFLAGWGTFMAWDAESDLRGTDIRGLAIIGVAVLVAIFARMVQAESSRR